jgi:hypothetical protein
MARFAVFGSSRLDNSCIGECTNRFTDLLNFLLAAQMQNKSAPE